MRWNPTGMAWVAAFSVAAMASSADASPIRRASLMSRVGPNPPSSGSEWLDRAAAAAGLDRLGVLRHPSAAALWESSRGAANGLASPPIVLSPSSRLGRDDPILADVEAPRRREVVNPERGMPGRHLPEPGSFLLLATGVVGLALRRHLRRQHDGLTAAPDEAASAR